jgi:hypothetical protein
MNIWRNALSFAVTVVVFYALCTLLAVSFPAQFVGFMNALFHGMDFQILQRHTGFDWPGFCFAAGVMFFWALAFVALFSTLRRWLTQQD